MAQAIERWLAMPRTMPFLPVSPKSIGRQCIPLGRRVEEADPALVPGTKVDQLAAAVGHAEAAVLAAGGLARDRDQSALAEPVEHLAHERAEARSEEHTSELQSRL